MEYLLGIAVSLIVETAKKHLNINAGGTYFVLLVVSIVGATAYYFLSHTNYWSSIVEILTIAAAFHNLIIRRVNNQNESD